MADAQAPAPAAADQYTLELVTPERQHFSGQVIFAAVPGAAGELGFLARHTYLLAELKPGVVRITLPDDTVKKYAISTGFVQVHPDQVVVLADTAEPPETIDIARAEKARQRALDRLNNLQAEMDTARARAALARALARLKAAGK